MGVSLLSLPQTPIHDFSFFICLYASFQPQRWEVMKYKIPPFGALVDFQRYLEDFFFLCYQLLFGWSYLKYVVVFQIKMDSTQLF